LCRRRRKARPVPAHDGDTNNPRTKDIVMDPFIAQVGLVGLADKQLVKAKVIPKLEIEAARHR
jgi:hypothetical protein